MPPSILQCPICWEFIFAGKGCEQCRGLRKIMKILVPLSLVIPAVLVWIL
jgi:hypothetical protein